MDESTALANASATLENLKSQLPMQTADSEFRKVTESAGLLPWLVLGSSSSEITKKDLLRQGNWGIKHSADKVNDLGKSVDILIVAWRPKAHDSVSDPSITSYDHNSAVFKDIAARARAGNMESGCMSGPEFLIYVPSADCWATYFAVSKTAKNNADQWQGLMAQMATISSTLLSNSQYSWHGPTIMKCNTPPVSLPDIEEIKLRVDNFLNPKIAEPELAPAGSGDKDRLR